MNLALTLAAAARAVPGSPALVRDDEVLCDYRRLAQRVAARAGDLVSRHKVRPGDTVVLYLTNAPVYLELLYAVWWAGAVAVPLNAKLHPREVADLVNDCGATILFVSPGLADPMVDLLPSQVRVHAVTDQDNVIAHRAEPINVRTVAPNDRAWLFYTSGTTGRPKGAVLTHANLMAMSMAYLADVESVDERSGLLHLAPMSHAGGLFALPFVARGARQVVPSEAIDPSSVAHLLSTHERLSFFAPPVLLRRLCADSGVRQSPVERMGTVLVGAAPVHAVDLTRAVDVFGPRVWNGYGQGESPCTITAMDVRRVAAAVASGDASALSSVGVPRIGTQVRVVDREDRELPDGEIGEITVSGPTVMSGYHDRPLDSAQTLRGGWLHTGDLGRLDDLGLLTLLDRSKDLVISGGSNIYPREVEEVLVTHEGVSEVAVVGLPDEEWGERAVAFVVQRSPGSVDAAALDALCLERIARFKRPKEYHMVQALPRNAAGKVLKTQLRQQITPDPSSRMKEPG